MTNPHPPLALDLDQVIDPEMRAEIGNPVPITFAATVVYLPLLVAGLLTSVFWTRTITTAPWSSRGLAVDVGAGAAIALALVLVTYVLARTLKPFEVLEQEFRAILGHLSHRQIIWIAVLSGAAEELLFRGTLQPWLTGLWGPSAALVASSLVFGLLHFVPDRAFIPWTIFATVVGFICGGLFQAFDSVVPPAVAHILLNAINLELIVNGGRKSTPAPDRRL